MGRIGNGRSVREGRRLEAHSQRLSGVTGRDLELEPVLIVEDEVLDDRPHGDRGGGRERVVVLVEILAAAGIGRGVVLIELVAEELVVVRVGRREGEAREDRDHGPSPTDREHDRILARLVRPDLGRQSGDPDAAERGPVDRNGPRQAITRLGAVILAGQVLGHDGVGPERRIERVSRDGPASRCSRSRVRRRRYRCRSPKSPDRREAPRGRRRRAASRTSVTVPEIV